MNTVKTNQILSVVLIVLVSLVAYHFAIEQAKLSKKEEPQTAEQEDSSLT